MGQEHERSDRRRHDDAIEPASARVHALQHHGHWRRYNHTLAVKNDGTVWAWGANANGQLGDASTTQRTSPVQMSGVTGASAVAGGSVQSLILKSDGTVRAVGNNFYGQLGDGTTTQRTSSVSTGLTSVVAIAAVQNSSYALKSNGTFWAWGTNASGQLGDGTTTQRTSPTQASSLSSISIIAAGALDLIRIGGQVD
jgi:alpha-tubulin suppressor-like RCC1 family protein